MSTFSKISELERREAEMFPDEAVLGPKAELSVGDDAFSKDMRAHGLLHRSQNGGETRIFHAQLPPSLDLFALGDFPDADGSDGRVGVGTGTGSHDTIQRESESGGHTATNTSASMPPLSYAALSTAYPSTINMYA